MMQLIHIPELRLLGVWDIPSLVLAMRRRLGRGWRLSLLHTRIHLLRGRARRILMHLLFLPAEITRLVL